MTDIVAEKARVMNGSQLLAAMIKVAAEHGVEVNELNTVIVGYKGEGVQRGKGVGDYEQA